MPEAKQGDFADNSWRQLNLPHDWSIEGTFSKDNSAGVSEGALPGGIGWSTTETDLYNTGFFVDHKSGFSTLNSCEKVLEVFPSIDPFIEALATSLPFARCK